MRIIGGQAAGRIVQVPEGLGVRPMPDKVKLAVFNSLGDRVVGARVLDLFSGTGALGHECLSRGAAALYSVERSEKHARCYRRNLETTGLPASAVELRVMDVFAAVPQLKASGRHFDLVIADPPYGEKNVGRRSESAAQRLLDTAELPGLLAPGGLLVLGHARRDTVEWDALWREHRTLRHGDTLIRFLQPAEGTHAA
ncbi:MAG: RsmD family RNA methyltransferase [Verrucomicrobiae bacterium]|nr:RsmD family RNA methyltransferase [Verrucomicrobiae bacterium]